MTNHIELVLHVLELAGLFVFAMSGVLTAGDEKMDLFGAAVIGFVTAVGGGTLRDILIGCSPVGWMVNSSYLIMITAGILVAILLRNKVAKLQKTMFLFDAIGIGLYTILGLQKTLEYGLSPAIAVMMGTVSAVFGGVVRDVLVNRVPLIFRKEIYATACFVGGIVYIILQSQFDHPIFNMLLAMGIITILRISAVLRKWSLPLPNMK